MTRLLDRLTGKPETRYSMDDYLGWLGGINSPWNIPGQVIQTWGQNAKLEAPSVDYTGNAASFAASGPVFSLMAVRLRLFSQVRWAYQQLRSGKPGELFSLPGLDVLNGDPCLNAWMIRHVDLAGNFYGVVDNDRVWPLRPDWVQIGCDKPLEEYDSEPVVYFYFPGGPGITKLEDAVTFPAEEVIHWMPEPDPLHRYRGMSWLTPVAREMMSDVAATEHKNKFFANAATPNMVVKFDKDTSFEAFTKFKDAFTAEHEGSRNAYKTLFLGGGADTTIVGTTFQQMDFKSVQGAGETRLANAAGVHPVVVGFSEGMQGSSLNAGNFGQARRSTADSLLHPLWVSAAGALGKVLPAQSGARLWYDARDIPFLREDAKDDAAIKAQDAQTMRTLVDAGFEPESVKNAVRTGDWAILQHTGLFSVQLQPPGTSAPASSTGSRTTLRLLRDHPFGPIQGGEWVEEG